MIWCDYIRLTFKVHHQPPVHHATHPRPFMASLRSHARVKKERDIRKANQQDRQLPMLALPLPSLLSPWQTV